MSSVGETATTIAARVRAGELDPVAVVAGHLDHIGSVDARVGAFEVVDADGAIEAARALKDRADLADLALAGVPIAVKDNVPVAGLAFRNGSDATSPVPARADGPVATALRAAGAVIVGKTRVPELDIWPMCDNAFGTTRNPWDLSRVPGGSSGGSAASVASAMTPVAHGADGAGSIRIPAACCGVFGIKPGPGVVPDDGNNWMGMSEHGPLATTVADAALLLDALAGTDRYRQARLPESPLRVAVSAAPPGPGIAIAEHWARAVGDAGEALAGAGHHVTTDDPPAPPRNILAIAARWTGGPAEEAEGLDRSRLERRTRVHVRIGALLRRGARESAVERWAAEAHGFFSHHDVLITPPLAHDPLLADAWRDRGWMRSFLAAFRFAPMTSPWNLARFPAASVPAGRGPAGLPLAVQLIAPRGEEARLLEVARLLEELAPWPRHAPLASVPG